MVWFKVDDGFALHPKAIAAGNAALGLWVRAGSWCGANLSDGYLPAAVVPSLGARPRDAQRLVDVGLWEPVRTSDQPAIGQTSANDRPENSHRVPTDAAAKSSRRGGLLGYRFRDWEHYQPTKAQVTADRDAMKERQRRHRERVRHGVTDGVTNTVTNGVTNAAPTRPDLSSGLGSQSLPARSTDRNGDGPDLDKIANILGTDTRWAARVATQILERAPAGVRDQQRYVEAAVRERPADYRPTPTPPRKEQQCELHGRDRATCPPTWHEEGA